MIDSIKQPFANYGNIVYGEEFVGREDAIRTIRQRIVSAYPSPGCLSIVGPPRIGKSSLAYQTLIYPQSSLLKQQLIAIRINLPSEVDSKETLLRKFVSKTLIALEDADLENEALFLKGNQLLEKNLSWLELQDQVQIFFTKVKKSGWRVVIVIDEFDAARSIFQENQAIFQSLREFAYNPDWRVGLVTVSRRSLSQITNQSRADISNFAGIFLERFIHSFTSDELAKLLNKLKDIGIEISQDIFEFFWKNTGGHPYLASALGFQIASMWLENKQFNLDLALQDATPAFLKYYDNLIEILQEDNSLENLLEILYGPVIKATKIDAENLQRYGLIKSNANDYYEAFSSHFEDYLRLVGRSVELWPLWRDTERKLRVAISEVMEQEYGTEDWIPKLEKARPKLQAMLDRCRQAQEKEKKSFGGRASNNLLDFTYPQNLLDIMSAHWGCFESILGQNKKYWADRFQLLAKLRNPMAHTRDEVIKPFERQVAEGYCREILHLLDKAAIARTESE